MKEDYANDWARFGLITLLLAIGLQVPANVVQADASGVYNCTNPGPYFDGKQFNPPESSFRVRGMKAFIEAKTPGLCETSYALSYSWVMLTNGVVGNQGRWAQIGVMRFRTIDGGFYLQYQWQWTQTNGSVLYSTLGWGNPVKGVADAFKVQRNYVDGKIYLYKGGILAPRNEQTGFNAITGYDPEETPSWNSCGETYCFEGQMEGETNYAESDIAGVSADPQDFTGVNEYDWDGDAFAKDWVMSWWEDDTPDCPTFMHLDDNSGAANDGDHFWVWTHPTSRSAGCY